MDSGLSYAICWREGDGTVHVGKLEVDDGYLALDGPQHLSIAIDEIVGVRIGRLLDERVCGLPSLVVERAGGVAVFVTSPVGFGSVQELAQLLDPAGSRRQAGPLSVVVVGGGVAALEAMVALRALAEERVAITLVSASPRFSYRPLAVARPFDSDVPTFELAELAAGSGAELVVDEVVSVDVAAHTIATEHSGDLAYDVLLVATGARPRAALPGATTFWDGEAEPFETLLAELSRGAVKRLVFALPPRTVWPLPLYELALLTSARLAELGVSDVRLTFVTPEDTPLALFGREAGEAVTRLFEERGIELLTGTVPVRFDDGALGVVPHGTVRADRVVSAPQLVGVHLEGLPADEAGFLPVDRYGHVRGVPDVFAAGDATTLPVKQGGIAAQQADAVAETIAARAGADVLPTPFRPVLRAMLLTGSVPLFFRTELGGGRGETAVVADEPLWWPPGKIAARYLGPYLAARELDPVRDP
jgi:sulfide:quinone oxidoreductase